MPVTRSLSDLRLDLEMLVHCVRDDTSSDVDVRSDKKAPTMSIVVGERVRVSLCYGSYGGKEAKKEGAVKDTNFIVLEWESSPSNDLLADAIVAVVLKAEPPTEEMTTAEAVRESARKDGDTEKAREMELCIAEQFFIAQFGDCECDAKTGNIALEVNGVSACVAWDDSVVHCEDEPLKDRLQRILARIKLSLGPTHSPT